LVINVQANRKRSTSSYKQKRVKGEWFEITLIEIEQIVNNLLINEHFYNIQIPLAIHVAETNEIRDVDNKLCAKCGKLFADKYKLQRHATNKKKPCVASDLQSNSYKNIVRAIEQIKEKIAAQDQKIGTLEKENENLNECINVIQLAPQITAQLTPFSKPNLDYFDNSFVNKLREMCLLNVHDFLNSATNMVIKSIKKIIIFIYLTLNIQ